jgi:hypothetical protein
MAKIVKKTAKTAAAGKKVVKKPVATKPAAKTTKKPVSKKAPAKKPVRKTTRAAKVVDAIRPCKTTFTQTEIIGKMAEAAGVEPKQVKALLAWQQRFIIANLMKGGTGKVKMLGWMFKSLIKPAVKGGQKKPNPFKPGEMYITKNKPAVNRAKALAMKVIKDGIAL